MAFNGEKILGLLQEFDEDDYDLLDEDCMREFLVEIVRTSNPGPFILQQMSEPGFDSCFAQDFDPKLVKRVEKFLKRQIRRR